MPRRSAPRETIRQQRYDALGRLMDQWQTESGDYDARADAWLSRNSKPVAHTARRWLLAALLVAGLAGLTVFVLGAGGCAGQFSWSSDGLTPEDAAAAGGTIGTLIGGPGGGILGAGVGAVVGHFAGRSKGWDEKEQDEIKRRGLEK